MSGQGCPHEGSDHRLLGSITCWLERHGTFASRIPPPQLRLEFLGLRLYLPWRRAGQWVILMARLHLWRYDYYNRCYIFFSAALKRIVPTDAA